MPEELDLLNRRILFELDCNSRRSLSELSRKVRLGRDLVSYRIDRLREAGVLNKCTVMINPYKLGLTVYKTYLKLEADRARCQEFLSYLDGHPRTSWVAECYGKWDAVWCVLARSPKEVYDLQDRLFSEFRDIIIAYNVCTLVNYWWFPKKYLLKRNNANGRPADIETMNRSQGWQFEEQEFTFGTTPLEHTLDQVEYGIVKLLSEDAQMSVTEIARQLDTTPAIVKYRIEKLEQLGIIAGYRVDIDRSALGMTVFKVQLHPRHYDASTEAELHNFCRLHPQIATYELQLGDCKIEFEIEAKDYAEFNNVIDEIRERFSGYIRSLDYIMVRRDYFHRMPCNVFIADKPDAEQARLEPVQLAESNSGRLDSFDNASQRKAPFLVNGLAAGADRETELAA